MKFSQTHSDWNGELLETVTLETKQDLQIDDALEAFGRFLRAAGYYFDGEIRIVDNSDQQSLDDLFDELEDDGQDFVQVGDMVPAFEGEIEGLDKNSWVDHYINDQASKQPANNEWPFPTTTKP